MAFESGFFDSTEAILVNGFYKGNKAKDASFMAKYFSAFLSDGVYPEPYNGFKVTASGSGLEVIRDKGKAFLRGYFCDDDASRSHTFEIDTQAHIYYYVLRLDEGAGTITEEWYTDPTTGSVPERSKYIFELVIATIEIPAHATTIDDTVIIDTRYNANYCGIVKLRANIDFDQWQITADMVEDTDTKAIPTITGSPLEFLRGDGTWGGAPTMNVTADDVIPTATRAIPTITGSPLEFLRGDGTFSSLIKAGKYSFVPNGDNVDIITEVGDISNFAVPAYYRLLPPNGATVTNAANSLKPSTNTTYATFTQSGQQMNILYIYDGMPIFDEASKNITITVKIKYSATTSGITAFLYDLDTGADINTYKALLSTSGATQTITLSWAFTVFSNLNAKKIGLRICRTATSNMTFNVYGTDITVTQNVSGRVMAQLTPNGIEPNNTRMARIESAIDQILS